MSRKDSFSQKGNSISAKDHPGRTPTKAATELRSLAKDARLPPPATSASLRAKLSHHALEQVASKSTSGQTRGRSFGNNEIKKVSPSRQSNISGYDDQSSARTSIVSQLGSRSKASRQSEQRHDSSAPLFQTAAANNRVKLHQPDRKYAVIGTPEKKAVSKSRISRDSSGDNCKGVWSQKSAKDLCKRCKSSMLESVCFIANDGRITAVRTVPASVHRLHVCDSPRCAANPNYKPFLVVSKKILAAQRLSLPSQFAKDKISAPSRLGIRSVASSAICSLHGDDSPRSCVSAPFESTRKSKNGTRGSSHSGGRSAVDQNRSDDDEQSHNLGTASHCGTSVVDQNVDSNCGLFPHEDGLSSNFVRELEDEKSGIGVDMESGNECCIPVAHEKPASITESQDRHEAGVLEGECCTPVSQEDGASSYFIRDSEDERSCGGSNTGFGSECSTPMFAQKNSALAMGSSQDKKKCGREEDGDLESTCSTPLGYNNGQSGACESFYHHGDDELSCTDDDREGTTMRDNTISILSTSPGKQDFPNSSLEQSSNKLQRKRSSVSRMRRNYLNMLKEQEAETVRLRKQEIQKRKQAGDWMLDCAIEEVLHKLAPNGETRVKVIVEAFETVMSHSDSETQQHPVMHF